MTFLNNILDEGRLFLFAPMYASFSVATCDVDDIDVDGLGPGVLG